MSNGRAWSAERDAELRRLIEGEGLSAGDVAAVLGVTRNAAIGRAYRLGMQLANGAAGKKVLPAASNRASAPPGVSAMADGAGKSSGPSSVVPILAEPPAARGMTNRGVEDRARRARRLARKAAQSAPDDHIAPAPTLNGPREAMTLLDDRLRQGCHCRWPVREDDDNAGRWFFCAADVPAPGDVYCGLHAKAARTTAAALAQRREAETQFKEQAARLGRAAVASAGKRTMGRLFA